MRFQIPLLILATLAPVRGASPFLSRQEAESRVLNQYDAQLGEEPIPCPHVRPQDQMALRWLLSAMEEAPPPNPFPKGTRLWREAASLRALVQSPASKWTKGIRSQNLSAAGTSLAFWRWGQRATRQGAFSPSLRTIWEDRLLEATVPPTLQGLALRHALCFALAENDEARFTALKNQWSDRLPDLFKDFQNAFALLGSPAPSFSLWQLPGEIFAERSLAQLGGNPIWISFDEGSGLPDLPPGASWIVPTQMGNQPPEDTFLNDASQKASRQLLPRLMQAGRTAYLAPIRSQLESCALVFFPIRVDLDSTGCVQRIRMGDAAIPAQSPAATP